MSIYHTTFEILIIFQVQRWQKSGFIRMISQKKVAGRRKKVPIP